MIRAKCEVIVNDNLRSSSFSLSSSPLLFMIILVVINGAICEVNVIKIIQMKIMNHHPIGEFNPFACWRSTRRCCQPAPQRWSSSGRLIEQLNIESTKRKFWLEDTPRTLVKLFLKFSFNFFRMPFLTHLVVTSRWVVLRQSQHQSIQNTSLQKTKDRYHPRKW